MPTGKTTTTSTPGSLAMLASNSPFGPRRCSISGFSVFGGQPPKTFSWISESHAVLALEIARWNFPVVPLLVLSWAIARGSAAVSGELERGTLDLAMSRPMSRWTYLMAQVVSSLLGLAFMMLVLWLSNLLANRFYGIEEMPSALGVLRPCVNIFALGASVFGYTLLFSSFDVVRWRASLLGSAITIAGLVGYSVATADEFKERWGWLEWLTVFRGYAPVEAAVKAEQFGPNVGALCGVCAAGIIIAYLFFQGRDLPANS
jgi:ABC-2 type transport system permease protein